MSGHSSASVAKPQPISSLSQAPPPRSSKRSKNVQITDYALTKKSSAASSAKPSTSVKQSSLSQPIASSIESFLPTDSDEEDVRDKASSVSSSFEVTEMNSSTDDELFDIEEEKGNFRIVVAGEGAQEEEEVLVEEAAKKTMSKKSDVRATMKPRHMLRA